MPIERKYDTQMPFVGTKTQRDLLDQMARRRRTSVAEVVRAAVNEYFGLVDDEIPEDWTNPRGVRNPRGEAESGPAQR